MIPRKGYLNKIMVVPLLKKHVTFKDSTTDLSRYCAQFPTSQQCGVLA